MPWSAYAQPPFYGVWLFLPPVFLAPDSSLYQGINGEPCPWLSERRHGHPVRSVPFGQRVSLDEDAI